MRRFLIAIACSLVASPLLAQDTPSPEKEVQAPAQAQAAQAEAAQASRESSETEGVTYERVMADPDNVDLNFRWAKRQILAGDLKGASATLERIVSLKPNMERARLLYAVVLYRLDDMSEAERELNVLLSVPASADVKAEAERYLKLLRNRQRKTHYNAALSFGMGYDNNRNAAPSTGKAMIGGAPLQLSGAGLRRDDFSYPFVGTLGVSRDLSKGHKAFGSFSMYQSEQILAKNLNLKAYSLRGGAAYKTLFGNITPALQLDHVQLAQSTFLRGLGLNVLASHKVSPREERFFKLAYTYQDFVPTSQVRTARQRSGNLWEFGLGMGYWVRPAHRLAPSYSYLIKNAASSFNAYTRHELGIEHTWLLGKGMFLLSGFTAGYDRYVAPDFFVSPQLRTDDNYRFRSILGAPLSLLYAPLKDFLGTVTYEYYHSLSGLSNYGYTNNKLSAMVTYSWGI